MKKKKIFIYSAAIIAVVGILSFITIKALKNDYKLSSEESTWINQNINNVHSINVMGDLNIFSDAQTGTFFAFLEDFKEEYGLEISTINASSEDKTTNALINTKVAENSDNIIYTDHYVLVSNNDNIVTSVNELDDKSIGVLTSELDYIKSYLKDININYTGYETNDELFAAFDAGVNYIIVPRMQYIDLIFSKNYNIVYHLSDINTYYYFNNIGDTLGNILDKYLNKWRDNIDESIKKEELRLFKSSLGITDSDIDKLLSVDYNYGFINNSPYEVIMSGNYGGIIAEYLQEFSTFSGVYFDISRYRNVDSLVKSINKGKVDIYFDTANAIESSFNSTSSGILSSVTILTRKDNDKIFNSIYGLQGEEVYVLENSNIHKYLTSLGNVNVLTYKDKKELFKLNKKDVIIVMDKYIFDNYSKTKLRNYVSKFEDFIPYNYTFKINEKNDVLNTLMSKYISYRDNFDMINKGLNSHEETVKSGVILNNLAKYIILSIVFLSIIGIIVYRNSKKIKISRRIKNNEKTKFVDQLTCLKNRNYLSEFMKSWNNNKIYPQTIIVMDLNKLKFINNQYGVSEGDKQIQAAANALIKTQLDNSEIMRSDGNEFVIYTVGYNQKQIVNYIHKLNKELKKIPYDFGAEYGYSTIEDNLKTVEDALTEATNDMKDKKKDEK